MSVPPAGTAAHVLQIGSESLTGSRPENQDRVAHFDSAFGHVFVVADGMGGHRDGALAAVLATSRLPDVMRGLPESLPADAALLQSIELLNDLMLAHDPSAGHQQEGMGSTLAVVLVRNTADGFLAIGAHVGDSRIYFLRNGRLFCLTRDHTVVQGLVDAGQLTADEAFDHPKAGVLTAALGRPGPVGADVTPWMLLEPGDLLLLCSDGVSGYVSDAAIAEALGAPQPPSVLARQLVELALREHSADNISAIVVRVDVEERADTGA
jgi:PPM family protein phosphatase